MPTADERLRHVILKIERAKKHAADLDLTLRAFFDSNPYKVAHKHDPHTRKLIYYVSSVKPIPDSVPLIAGDAIQNLMSALDHLAYQLVCSDTGDKPPNPNWIYFPIADDVAKYEAKKHGKIEGAKPQTFDAIDAIKPYKGGNEHLWVLYRLNNIEKHRLLLTVGSQAAGVNIGQLVANMHPGFFPPEVADALAARNVFAIPADKGFPLQAGFELLIGDIDEKVNPKQQFRFNVVLNEAGILKGKPVQQTIQLMTNAVEGVVTALAPMLV